MSTTLTALRQSHLDLADRLEGLSASFMAEAGALYAQADALSVTSTLADLPTLDALLDAHLSGADDRALLTAYCTICRARAQGLAGRAHQAMAEANRLRWLARMLEVPASVGSEDVQAVSERFHATPAPQPAQPVAPVEPAPEEKSAESAESAPAEAPVAVAANAATLPAPQVPLTPASEATPEAKDWQHTPDALPATAEEKVKAKRPGAYVGSAGKGKHVVMVQDKSGAAIRLGTPSASEGGAWESAAKLLANKK